MNSVLLSALEHGAENHLSDMYWVTGIKNLRIIAFFGLQFPKKKSRTILEDKSSKAVFL